jgi:coenzyme F420-dependent glucose-6-phosphate dehydrogenase
MEVGYHLSSEEHPPGDLVRYAVRAEQIGLTHAFVSDHFHPWLDVQGESPFVWSVLGALARETERIVLGTGVTCPLIRMHPAIVAHAAATTATMLPGRFVLGLGTGENLNEHVTGERWPAPDERLEMLEEATAVIRRLLTGERVTHRGRHYRVEDARLYTCPDEPPPVVLAAMGPEAVALAGRISDGLVTIALEERVVERFHEAGGDGKPTYVKLTVCWAESMDDAKKTAREWFPLMGVGRPMVDLSMPADFAQVVSAFDEDAAIDGMVLGPDPEVHAEAIRSAASAGFSHVYVHQVGPEQDGFLGFFEAEVLPRLG